MADPAGSAPFAYTADLAGLTGDALRVQIVRNTQWGILSEVTFETAPIPVPAAGFLLLGALGGLAALRRARRAARAAGSGRYRACLCRYHSQ